MAPKTRANHAIARAALAVALATGVAHADVVAVWNFNDRDLIVDREYLDGTPTLTVRMSSAGWTTGTTLGSVFGDPAGICPFIVGPYHQPHPHRPPPPQPTVTLSLLFDTTGWEGLSMSVAAAAFRQSSEQLRVSYTTDGGATWTAHATMTLSDIYSLYQYDLSAIASLRNNPRAGLRFSGVLAPRAGFVIDNLVLRAEPIPGPGALVLLGGLAARPRRRY